jgi:lipoate-protein ligase A
MMYHIRSASHDATFNLALEQYVFDRLDRGHSYMMLWRNANAVIIGKHQNTVEEINAAYVKEQGIQVARRLSGGGAVYHDLGNVNFTFITDAEGEDFDFALFCRPVAWVLRSLGADVLISGRNDMTIKGMKFSGNAQYIKQGRIMHHGTILFDSDLSVLSKALTVSPDKIESKGIKSASSRVTNVRPHLTEDCGPERFMDILEDALAEQFRAQPLPPGRISMDEARRIQGEVYASWEWNYGVSPAYRIRKKRRFEGAGEIEARMEVSDGCVTALAFFGDFFAVKEWSALAAMLTGVQLRESSIAEALRDVPVDDYFKNLRKEDLTALLLGG